MHAAKPVLFVGDAAGGVPYLRSINASFKTVEKTAHAALSIIETNGADLEKNPQLKAFEKNSKRVWNWEIFAAKSKKVALIVWDFFKGLIGKNQKIIRLF